MSIWTRPPPPIGIDSFTPWQPDKMHEICDTNVLCLFYFIFIGFFVGYRRFYRMFCFYARRLNVYDKWTLASIGGKVKKKKNRIWKFLFKYQRFLSIRKFQKFRIRGFPRKKNEIFLKLLLDAYCMLYVLFLLNLRPPNDHVTYYLLVISFFFG